MEKFNIKISILPNIYRKEDGIFDRENALNLSGKIAGVCYDKEGFEHLENEPIEKTTKRIERTLTGGHHSVYDHVNISFNISGLPKILAMVLNNEHQYTTSEKSARYTPVEVRGDSIITSDEVNLYNKWMEIFKVKIKENYGYIYDDSKIVKLAQENARYMVTVFMPTEMIYTTSLRQINYIASWMNDYIKGANKEDDFERKLSIVMEEFVNELKRLDVFEERLNRNEKNRKLSLFGDCLGEEEYFGRVYNTTYEGTFAQLAQAHRHRTLDYKMERLENKKYYIPPIIRDDKVLVEEWMKDILSLRNIHPQGEIVLINEKGKYEDFILKCKERLCSAAQLEIAQQTAETLKKYATRTGDKFIVEDIKNYLRGARCTFLDYSCPKDCGFKEGKTLTRRI